MKGIGEIFEINVLELPKLLEESDHSKMWSWMKFLGSNREEELSVLSMENEMIGKVVGRLKELSEDERVRMIYEEREKARMDYQSGMNGAYDTGKEDGIEKGIEILIIDNIEEKIPEERILQKLQKRFELSEKEAKIRLERYRGNF